MLVLMHSYLRFLTSVFFKSAGLTGETLIRKCLTMVGVHNYAPVDLAKAAELLPRAWKENPSAFEAAGLGESTTSFPLAEIGDAFAEASKGGRRVTLEIGQR